MKITLMSILHFLLLHGDMAVTVSDLRITLYIIEYHDNKIILYICQPGLSCSKAD